MTDSFGSHGTLQVGSRNYRIARLAAVEAEGYPLARLPFGLRVLLENLLRREDGEVVTADAIRALAGWRPEDPSRPEIAFMPARVLLQDFTGVPAVVDLAAMREAMRGLGGDPRKINPLQPVELVIDHSVQVDAYGSPDARERNAAMEYQRNGERYAFLRWGQSAFDAFRVVPPETGIVHQVNLEYLARVVFGVEEAADGWAYPDTVVGTDSHTTMVNGLGVLGWGVGGIEAEAAMLGQPVSMLIPDVVGFRLAGSLREGATATDLVLTVTQMLRRHGVVGKFVEFFGDGLPQLSLADRATIANMAPEYGATCGLFPIDAETLRYLEFSGRDPETVALVEAYAKEQGLFHEPGSPEAEYSAVLELDLSTVVPSVAGPRRPQDRLALSEIKSNFATEFEERMANAPVNGGISVSHDGAEGRLRHGSVVIAAITSCTNTSNPSVMLAAGLVAKKAWDRGLKVDPWVKTSLAPGSKVVTRYLQSSGLLDYLEKQRFHVVGYGCTTCIGNSGPLPPSVDEAIGDKDLVVASVLSGNRNFEGRVHPAVRASYLASPPLVVAYALAGRVDFDPEQEPLGTGADGEPVFLRDVWPTQAEISEAVATALKEEMFESEYSDVFAGSEAWRGMEVPVGDTYAWDDASTYVRNPPYFEGMGRAPEPVRDVEDARCLALLGDSITTDHISPAGSIRESSPAGRYLREHGVEKKDFNSYGSRRGNHEVMMRGTFANVRLRNQLVPGVEGGETLHLPDGEPMSIYDAAMRYREEGVPLVVVAGSEYGTGSSRDWAAKGPALLGVRAVLARSYERIHRSNLIGMGVLPLQFEEGESAESLGITGRERFSVIGLKDVLEGRIEPGRRVKVAVESDAGERREFAAVVRIDTPQEARYYQHGGILQYVLRNL